MSTRPLDFQISSFRVNQHPVGTRAWPHLLAFFPRSLGPLPPGFLIQVALPGLPLQLCPRASAFRASAPSPYAACTLAASMHQKPPPRPSPSPPPQGLSDCHILSCSSPPLVRGRQLLGTAFIKEPHCPPQASSAAPVHTR